METMDAAGYVILLPLGHLCLFQFMVRIVQGMGNAVDDRRYPIIAI
jgi:hypothetical protein